MCREGEQRLGESRVLVFRLKQDYRMCACASDPKGLKVA